MSDNLTGYLSLPEIMASTPAFEMMVWIVLIIALVDIFVVTRDRRWGSFAGRRKWLSRFVTLILALFVIIPLFCASGSMYVFLPGKITIEEPNLTASAIKLGLYGLYLDHEVSNMLPPDKKDLVQCVDQLSEMKAKDYQKECGDNQTCYNNIPPLTRAALIEAIQSAQSAGADNLTKFLTTSCQHVDITHL